MAMDMDMSMDNGLAKGVLQPINGGVLVCQRA